MCYISGERLSKRKVEVLVQLYRMERYDIGIKDRDYHIRLLLESSGRSFLWVEYNSEVGLEELIRYTS